MSYLKLRVGAVFFFWKGQKGWKPLFFFNIPYAIVCFSFKLTLTYICQIVYLSQNCIFYEGSARKHLKNCTEVQYFSCSYCLYGHVLQEVLEGNCSKASGGVFVSEWVGAGGFFSEGGGCINSPLDGEKCSAAEMHSKVGGELHGFHDYQVLWLGCGFGSVVA